MKLRIPFLLKLGIPLFVLLTITFVGAGIAIFRDSTFLRENELNARLKQGGAVFVESLKKQDFSKINTPNDTLSDTYASIHDQLKQMVEISGIAWAGVYILVDGKFFYLVDADDTGVLYPFFYATPEHFKAALTNEITDTEYVDEYGSWKGVDIPFEINWGGNKKTKALLELSVDKNANAIINRDTVRYVSIVVLVALSLITFVSSILARFTFNRRILLLQKAGKELSRGNFGYTLQVTGNDELSDLGNSFNSMSQEIRRLHLEQLEMQRKRNEEETAHLHKIVGLAASVSDKLNSPLLTIVNTVEILHKLIDQSPAVSKIDHEEQGGQKFLKSWSMLRGAVSEIEAVSNNLAQLREHGHKIEATKAIRESASP